MYDQHNHKPCVPQTFSLPSGSISAGTGYLSSTAATLPMKAGPLAGEPCSIVHQKPLIFFLFSGPFNRSWERRWKRILKPCVLSYFVIFLHGRSLTVALQQRELSDNLCAVDKATQQRSNCERQWWRQQELEWQQRSIGSNTPSSLSASQPSPIRPKPV